MTAQMSMYDRWAADEELDGRYADVDDTKPRWVEDNLGAVYGPDASHQGPPRLDTPPATD